MTRKEIAAYIRELDLEEDVIVADNMDGAFLGVITEEEPPKAVYSIERCINILAEEMSHEDAKEFFWFNVAGAGGKGYPIYINTPEEAKSPY
jgi:hypothetical protein